MSNICPIKINGSAWTYGRFGVFGPLCFAWLVRRGEQVAQTIADRSITIELRRKMKSETVTRLRSNRTGHLTKLGRRAAKWVDDNRAKLRDADPELPDELNDRAQDNWRPLIAIADAMSSEFGKRAREGAKVISVESVIADDDMSLLALADANMIFESRQAEAMRDEKKPVIAMTSEALVRALNDMQDRPWNKWRKGEPMTKHSLARLFKKFVRFSNDEGDSHRGYEARAIKEAKERYVDTETGLDLETEEAPF